MKILIYCDNHFSQYSSIVRGRGDVYSTRLKNQIESVNWAEQLAVDKSCDLIVHLGDFFDKPDLNAEELTALKDIKWANIKHKFIVGNHELGTQDLDFNSLNALAKIGDVITKPTLDCGLGYSLIYLPYILEINRKPLKSYIDELWAGLFTTQEVKHTIILSHNDISGIRYGQFLSTAGFDIEEISDNCDLFINGHVHNQSQINKKILNLGNLTGQNFSEDAEKYSHCAAVLDIDTLNVELINNPFALNFYKFDILTLDDLVKLEKCKENAVLSIRAYRSLIPDIKEAIKNYNIINYRIITIPELTENKEDIKQILKLDHIESFKTYIRENVDNSELLNDELSLI